MSTGTRSKEKCIFLEENFVFVLCGPQRMWLFKVERDDTWTTKFPLLTQFYFNNISPIGNWEKKFNSVKTAIFYEFLKNRKMALFQNMNKPQRLRRVWVRVNQGHGSLFCLELFASLCRSEIWKYNINALFLVVTISQVKQKVYRSTLYLLKGLMNCRNEKEERNGLTL